MVEVYTKVEIDLLLAGLQGGGAAVPTGPTGSFNLVFEDTFSGTALDTTKWYNCWHARNLASDACGSMNGVATSAANVAVSGGNLALTLSSATVGACVQTKTTYGAAIFEARVQFPGNGYQLYNWPAFWVTAPLPVWPAGGETDIAEVLSGVMTINYWDNSDGSGNGVGHDQGQVQGYWGGSFHTFTLHRKATTNDVYYDGVKVKTFSTTDNGAQQKVVLNIGVGQGSKTVVGQKVLVDYVRVWQ